MAIRVFVVEDEKIVSLDLQTRLQNLGYEVVGAAGNGALALTQIGELLPDVILLDVSLQASIDGVEVAARIRENMRIPIVFITAFSDPDLIKRIQLTEPFAYILKPFETVEVHAALQIAVTRAKLERQLIDQKKLLTATLDTIVDGVIVTGEDGMVRFMNPAAERLTGWGLAEAACHPLHDIYQIAEDGTLAARDGAVRRVESRSHLMKDDLGNWMGFVHTFVDVTEREESRKALRERELEYRILMEQAADAIIVLDETGRFIAVNSKACELAGFPREELLQMSIQDLMIPDEVERDPFGFDTLRAGRAVIKERQVRRKDGSLCTVEVHATMLSDGRFQGIVRDVTAQKKIDATFKDAVRSEVVDKLLQKLRGFAHGESAAMNLNRLALFCDNPDALTAPASGPDVDAPPERFRSAAEEFLGVIEPELKVVASLAAIIEADPAFAPAGKRLAGVATRLSGAVESVRSTLPHLVATVAAADSDGTITDLAMQLQDLSDAVQRTRTSLHEISESLQTELTCDLEEVLKIALSRFQASASPVACEGAEDLKGVRVLMKGSDLADVLSTLIQNGIEAFSDALEEEKRRVIVRVHPPGGKVRIDVEDNGPGVPEENREKIFESMFSTKGEGRGFGLPHALQCLKGCGGALRLDPSAENGARFVVEVVRV